MLAGPIRRRVADKPGQFTLENVPEKRVEDTYRVSRLTSPIESFRFEDVRKATKLPDDPRRLVAEVGDGLRLTFTGVGDPSVIAATTGSFCASPSSCSPPRRAFAGIAAGSFEPRRGEGAVGSLAASFRDRRLCPENYNAASGEGLDQPDTDPFYSWSALLPYMAAAELMDVSPFEGWTLTNRATDEARLAPVLMPGGPVSVERKDGLLTLMRNGAPVLATDIAGRIAGLPGCLRHADEAGRASIVRVPGSFRRKPLDLSRPRAPGLSKDPRPVHSEHDRGHPPSLRRRPRDRASVLLGGGRRTREWSSEGT